MYFYCNASHFYNVVNNPCSVTNVITPKQIAIQLKHA